MRQNRRQRFWCMLDQKGSFCGDLNLPQWRSQGIEIGGKFIVPQCPSSDANSVQNAVSKFASWVCGGVPAAKNFSAFVDKKERF